MKIFNIFNNCRHLYYFVGCVTFENKTQLLYRCKECDKTKIVNKKRWNFEK